MDFRLFQIKQEGIFKSRMIVTENEAVKYTAVFSGVFSKLYQIFDHSGKQIMVIEKPFHWGGGDFEVYVYGSKVCSFKPSIFNNNLEIQSTYGYYAFKTESSWRTHFTILNSTTEIGKISRKHGLLKDEFGVALMTNENVEFLLAMVIYIIKRKKEQEATSAS